MCIFKESTVFLPFTVSFFLPSLLHFSCLLPSFSLSPPNHRPPDASPSEKSNLLLRKIEQCCFIFDFADPMSDLRAKEVKRAALTEILDHITMVSGALIAPVYPALIQMVLYPCTHPHIHAHTHTLYDLPSIGAFYYKAG